jgi:hypothetical protein
MTSDSGGNAQPRGEHTDAPRSSLHICPECDSRLGHPQSIEMWRTDSWRLELRCPECDWISAEVFGLDAIEEFEKELEQGHERLEADLMELIRMNMSDYVDRFVYALAADAIYPMDF